MRSHEELRSQPKDFQGILCILAWIHVPYRTQQRDGLIHGEIQDIRSRCWSAMLGWRRWEALWNPMDDASSVG